MKRALWMVAGTLTLAVACGGGSKETKAEATPAAAAPALVAAPPAADLVAHCLKFNEQLALCKDQAIDMLMDERAKANPDFAKMLADTAQKTAAREQGVKELEQDGAGPLEARTAMCQQRAAGMPAQVPQAMVDAMNATASCWDKPCADRVNCLRPFTAMAMKAMPAPAAAPAK